MASTLVAMASNLLAVASTLVAMALNLPALASNLLAMASTLVAMASTLLAMASTEKDKIKVKIRAARRRHPFSFQALTSSRVIEASVYQVPLL